MKQHHSRVMAALLPREIRMAEGRPALCSGQLRSDLIRTVGARADGYRLCRRPPDRPGAEEWESGPPTAGQLAEWAASTDGRWDWYCFQLTGKGELLLSLGRWGTEMMLFGLTRRQAAALSQALADYPELHRVRTFSMPGDGERRLIEKMAGRKETNG